MHWPQLPWGELVQALASQSVLEVQAAAIGLVVVLESGPHLIDCRGTSRVELRDLARPLAPPVLLNGDVYGGGAVGGMRGGFSANLAAGLPSIKLARKGKGKGGWVTGGEGGS